MKQKLIYILSLDHSGSTILDMALGCHPRIVGIGEAVGLLTVKYHELKDRVSLCACGEDIRTCPFWSRAREALLDPALTGFEDRYQKLMGVFRESFGEETAVVDSSKRASIEETFPFFAEHFDFYVILLARDVRGWIDSRRRKFKSNGTILALKWWRHHRRMLKYLESQNHRFMVAGYEELALFPEMMLKTISDFIGVEFHEDMLVPDKSGSHIVRGNLARLDGEKRRRFFYDARWMASSSLFLHTALFYPILRLNSRLVYSHFSGGAKGETDGFVFADRYDKNTNPKRNEKE